MAQKVDAHSHEQQDDEETHYRYHVSSFPLVDGYFPGSLSSARKASWGTST